MIDVFLKFIITIIIVLSLTVSGDTRIKYQRIPKFSVKRYYGKKQHKINQRETKAMKNTFIKGIPNPDPFKGKS